MSALRRLAAVSRIPEFWLHSAMVLALGLAHAFTVPFLSLFALDEAHFSAQQLGIYLAASALSGVLATTWLGKLSDGRLGRRRGLHLALLCAAIGSAAMCYLRGFAGLLLNATTLLAVGRAAFSQTFALARARFEADAVADLTLATNAIRMFFSLGWVIGPALAAVWLARFGWSGLYLASAGLFVSIGLLALRVRPAPGRAAVTGVGGVDASVLRYVRRPTVAALIAGFGLLFLCSNLNLIALPLLLVRDLAGAERDVGVAFGLAAGIELPLMLGVALLADRLGKGRLIVAGALVYAGYFIALALATQPWHAYLAQLLTAFVVSVFMGLGLSYFQDLLPGRPGASTALYVNAMTVGSVLSGALYAPLAGPLGSRGVLAVCSGLSLLAAALLRHADRGGNSRLGGGRGDRA
jgi:MFS transporter, SET family, sugar efflux transporter